MSATKSNKNNPKKLSKKNEAKVLENKKNFESILNIKKSMSFCFLDLYLEKSIY